MSVVSLPLWVYFSKFTKFSFPLAYKISRIKLTNNFCYKISFRSKVNDLRLFLMEIHLVISNVYSLDYLINN